MKLRNTLICIFLSMLIASASYAQTVYYWKDEKGVMNATTTPPPDNIKKYDTDGYSKDSKAEIEQYQRQEEQKKRAQDAVDTANRREYQAEEAAKKQQRAQQQQRKTQSEIQDSRNREADKLEAEARKNIPGSRGMTASQGNMLTNAARIRAGQEPVTHTTSFDSPPEPPKGAINVRTGEYYPPAAGGVIEPKTGTFMPDVGGGYIDSRTGKFIPKIGR